MCACVVYPSNSPPPPHTPPLTPHRIPSWISTAAGVGFACRPIQKCVKGVLWDATGKQVVNFVKGLFKNKTKE